ncbi:hypothetical protein AKJ64_00695 [candidate division MSBL1 archaeon SCGC-AAA259E17]|uniref:Prefoldin subunit beta n=1 Tax=candidate division MSBL1 archaeon SCGC-AAA259E17 TaxID=1698263 RepID=A0A133UH31_9EURY|nr:hypothetical protein AKJ64_00695 [candidate division MSBL1 archaeon SCGC-AAA259E17]
MIKELEKQKENLQQIAERKNRFKAATNRIKDGLDALDDADGDAEVFKVVGPVGIKTDKDNLENELSNKKERLDAQVESLEDRQSEIEEEAKEKQNKLRQMLSGGPSGPTGPGMG